MYMRLTDTKEVLETIASLKTNNSSGMDGISGKILKCIDKFIVYPLVYLINFIIRTSTFPSVLKMAVVIPLFKRGDRTDVSNYRPISLLSSISKIFEKIVKTRLCNYLDNNNILSDSQHGFRKGRSTVDAIAKLTEYIMVQNDKGKKVISVFVDLEKAFDTISHKILFEKMKIHGIGGGSLKWFISYFSGRKTGC